MKSRLLLIGAGGHCRVILDLLLQTKKYSVSGILDLKERVGDEVLGVPIIGTDLDLPKFYKKGIRYCFISVGSIGSPRVRIKLQKLAQEAGFIFPNIIHPSALISPRVSIGEGNFIAPRVIVNVNSNIGNHCILNTGAILEHDCQIGDFVHIAPGVVLSGGISVGDQAHIGTGSIVRQSLKIGSKSIIGAGSVVTKDIPTNVMAFGNPCKEQKNV
ncbi:MAG: acetyltransferase [Candidatus Omnitrophica bacterium]|nr:acetyltransferase [Candidatus Omnitrophota bacterium]